MNLNSRGSAGSTFHVLRDRSVVLALALAFALAGRAAAQSNAPLRVLYITGGGYHDYAAQKDIIAKGLSERLNARVTIDDEAGKNSGFRVSRHKDPNWLRDFDVVVYNICFADVKDNEWSEAIVRAHVQRQVPAVVLHCTMHSYNFRGDSPIWSMFLGVRTQRHQRQMAITNEVVKADHPILAGFPATWPNAQGELYEILDVYPTATPLLQAFGEESKKMQPTVWVNRFAGVKVFGTTLGHHNETMQSKEYLDLVAAGLKWVIAR